MLNGVERWEDREANKWTRGLCCSMAVYLHQLTGFQIQAIVWHVPDTPFLSWEDCCLAHAFVRAPDGRCLDANGYGTLVSMGELGKVWEANIGNNRHPQTGRTGQWWDARLEDLTVAELCEMRAACNDPEDPELLQEAHDWVRNKMPFLLGMVDK